MHNDESTTTDPDSDVVEAELVEDGLPESELIASQEGDMLAQASPSKLASATGLANRDPLALYMRDVQRYKLLSPDEEKDLAIKYYNDGDVDAARRMVTSNLRLVVKIAYGYRQAYKNILDLVQEGNIGLMQAVKKYDPYKGVKLSSYAAWWIRAYILRFILNNHRLVKLGTTQAQRKLFFNLQKEKSKLAAMGIEPTSEIIAERLNVPERDVVSMDMRLAAGDASLDAPVGNSDGREVSRGELLSSDRPGIDDALANAELGGQFTDKIHEFGAGLDGKEEVIFKERLVSEDPKTLQELGNGFGVSRERVRQIEKRLLKKLKEFLESQLGEAVIDVYEAP